MWKFSIQGLSFMPYPRLALIVLAKSFTVCFLPELPEESGNLKLLASITAQVFLVSS
jgi:hypothetical protein